MRVTEVPAVPGVLLLTPELLLDEGGFSGLTFDADVARAAGVDPRTFVLDSVARSARGVVRGLHVRAGSSGATLMRCSYGEVFAVVVDLRPAAASYGRWESFALRADAGTSLYVPAGCARGFQTMTEPSDVSYRTDRAHDPSEEVTVAFDDPALGIPWPLPVTAMAHSDRDAAPLDAAREFLALRTSLARRRSRRDDEPDPRVAR
ncbi:MAG: dTDP-4-dehydrorhamnose 3,5-epimerase family protein [Actinomycetes bacterium]